jgi:peptide/nickel transport system permease protein
MIGESVMPSLMLTIPTMAITSVVGVTVALVSAFRRGRPTDKVLMFAAVLGMSVSYLVYIVLGQYFGAFWVNQQIASRQLFAVEGYEAVFSFEPGAKEGAAFFNPWNWVHYCLLPVLIGVVVAVGYDTRFYRSVMVEECTKDYIRTARAKGASGRRIMFVHMLKNAMIPIVTRVMISFPFLLTGEILVETYFNIPGMGRLLITAINGKDFPVVQAVTAVFAAAVIVTVILTDVLYAVFDPRVRLK